MRLLAALLASLFILSLLAPVAAHAQATALSAPAVWLPKNDEITDAETWTPANGPFVVQGALIIKNGGSVTIEPGTIVKLAPSASISIANGRLDALGSAASPILFTSLADDSAGGDTNGDGGTTSPDENRWSYIETQQADSVASFDHVRFSYEGDGYSQAVCGGRFVSQCASEQYEAALIMGAGTVTMSHADFDWMPGTDLTIEGGTFAGDHLVFGSSYDIIHARQNFEADAPEVTIHDSSFAATTQDSPIWVDRGSPILNLEENWWGSPSGPSSAVLTDRASFTNPISPVLSTDDWLTSANLDSDLPDDDSNVLFLPGTEGSRLYNAGGKLWEPFDTANDGILSFLTAQGDTRVGKLALRADGFGDDSIYAADGDVLDEADGTDYYGSFEKRMDSLKASGTINDWKPIAYDWRYAPEDIVTHGSEFGGKIYYEEATETPYIQQELFDLASSSKTGKVTIVAHSAGGLVAKALMEQLGDATTSRLIDKVVFVGVPQSGAPEAVGALLFGTNEGISFFHGLASIVSTAVARSTADTLPGAYELLPSEQYFFDLDDDAHPVVSFSDQSLFEKDVAAFGSRITTELSLMGFLADEDDGRPAPQGGEESAAAILSRSLLGMADVSHAVLDLWQPPTGVTVYQVAGWGDDSTLAGIEFEDKPLADGLLGFTPSYRPITTEDGDGLVTVPSALLMGDGSSTPRYWFDLNAYEKDTGTQSGHSFELALPEMQDFIQNIIEGIDALPRYMTSSAPAPIALGEQLRFTLEGAGALAVSDDSGDETGIDANGAVEQSIPDSSFGTLGDIEYVTVPESGSYQVSASAPAETSANPLSLEIDAMADGSTTASQVVNATSTMLSLTVADGVADIADVAVATSTSESEATSTDETSATSTQQDEATSTAEAGATSAPGADAGGASSAPANANDAGATAPASEDESSSTPADITAATTATTPATTPTAATSTTTATTTDATAETDAGAAAEPSSQAASALDSLPASARGALSHALSSVLSGALHDASSALRDLISELAQLLAKLREFLPKIVKISGRRRP